MNRGRDCEGVEREILDDRKPAAAAEPRHSLTVVVSGCDERRDERAVAHRVERVARLAREVPGLGDLARQVRDVAEAGVDHADEDRGAAAVDVERSVEADVRELPLVRQPRDRIDRRRQRVGSMVERLPQENRLDVAHAAIGSDRPGQRLERAHVAGDLDRP